MKGKKVKQKGLAHQAKAAEAAAAEKKAAKAAEDKAAGKKPKKGEEVEEKPLTFAERRRANQQNMMTLVNAKYGKGAIGIGAAFEHRAVPRLSSGIFSLDYALGGGWGRGRVNVIWGDKSSSKTTTVLKTIALAQKTDAITGRFIWEVPNPIPMVVHLIDAEGAFDKDWAILHGVDVDALIYSKPETAEEAAEMIESSLRSSVDLVCLDSLAAMTPKAELEGSMDDSHVGTAARINAKMFRKVQAAINASSREEGGLMPTLIVINQQREKIGVMFGDSAVKPGGKAQDFFSSIEVRPSAAGIEYFDAETKLLPKKGKFKYVVLKNKLSPPKIHGEYEMMLGLDPKRPELKPGAVVEFEQVMEMAKKFSIFHPPVEGGKSKKWRIYGKSFDTKRELWEKFVLDHQCFTTLKRDVLHRLFPRLAETLKDGGASEQPQAEETQETQPEEAEDRAPTTNAQEVAP